jgi:hypothetical protein
VRVARVTKIGRFMALIASQLEQGEPKRGKVLSCHSPSCFS